ncbi:lamin tail domain-containing protein [Almyronema epifaneia]|uniref:Lamin tail domain-containing protein n=1 Tax=Almyronema epifaneia S1 TaxID=2991925 RepID=A0ABW6IE42_9CYAN
MLIKTWRPLSSLGVAALSWVCFASSAFAEGSYQINTNSNGGYQHLYEYETRLSAGVTRFAPYDRPLYVDIKTSGEVINVFICARDTTTSTAVDRVRVQIYAPNNGPLVYDSSADVSIPTPFLGNIVSSGDADGWTDSNGGTSDCATNSLSSALTRPIKYITTTTGAYEVRLLNETDNSTNLTAVSADTGLITLFDITVTPNVLTSPNPRENQGRLWSYNWGFYSASWDDANATDQDYYVLVPGGFPGTSFVWQLDLNNLAGGIYELLANNAGVDSPTLRGLSVPFAGNTVSPEYRQYLSYPTGITIVEPTQVPVITNFRFEDAAGEDNTISPGTTVGVQDSGFFRFTTDTDGTYAVIIDVDDDGLASTGFNPDGVYGIGDIYLRGDTVAGVETSIAWDGKTNLGASLPEGRYQARLQAITGEYHFVAADAESSGGNELGLTINRATPTGNSAVEVYWDDITGLELATTASSRPSSSLIPSYNRVGARHTWGGNPADGGGNGTTGAPDNSSTGYGGNGAGFGDVRFLDTYVYGKVSIAETPAILITSGSNPDAPLIDLGDAPDTYSTDQTVNNSSSGNDGVGAGHNFDPIDPRLYLGSNPPDGESLRNSPTLEGTVDDTSGDTPDDEDGVSSFAPLTTGSTSYSVTVSLANTTGGDAYLAGWIDFNQNGQFDTAEGVRQQVANGATSATLTWTGLSGLTAGNTYARFRLTTDTNIVSATAALPTGIATDGEVEDYPIAIAASPNYQVSPLAGQVIINEVLYNETGASAVENDEFIELYNASGAAIDLSNWQLADGNLIANDTDGIGSITGNSANPAYIFPPGTSLAAGEYAVIWIGDNTADHQAPEAAIQVWLGSPSKLNNAGDDVWLYDDQSRIVDYIAYGSGSAVNQAPPAALNLWTETYQSDLVGAGDGQSISLTPNGQDDSTSACWELTTSGDANGRCAGFLPTRDTNPSNRVISAGVSNNGLPNVTLVKRITAINGGVSTLNGDPLNEYVNDNNDPNDDASNTWPTPIENYLVGAIEGGRVIPGDEIEYTIYFLSNGGTDAQNVLLCDYIPTHTTFVPHAFNSSPAADPSGLPTGDRGIVLSQGTNTVALTNLSDGDKGYYFPPGIDPATTFPGIDCDGDGNGNNTNTNGAIVVSLGTLPYASSTALPPASNAYGFIRFRGQVK